MLYDSTLQSLDSIKDLPGVAADQSLVQELDSKRAYFSALRCLAIARSYALLSQYKNALALFSRALQYCPKDLASVSDEMDMQKPLNIDVTKNQTKFLSGLLTLLVTRHQGLVELHNLHEEAVKEAERKSKYALPLVERMDEYPANDIDLTNLVIYPPKLRPIPVKPIFLDLAWNYIDYPGRAKDSSEKAINGAEDAGQPALKKEAKKGWFGFGR